MTKQLSYLPIVVATYDDNDKLVSVEFDWSDSVNDDDDEYDEIVAQNDLPWTHQMDEWIREHPDAKSWHA